MANPTDELQKIFKLLSDSTRMRILHLLEREELMVQELMEVLGMAQSRVSRHLAILREARLLIDRRDGTYVFYRFETPSDPLWRDAWTLVRDSLREDSTAERDTAALERVLAARGERARAFFDSVGPEWDALRKVFNDDELRARAMTRLIPPGLRVADLGTGTGVLALELARLGVHVIGVDNSTRMLDVAAAKLAAEQIADVELRRGELERLPIEDDFVDAAFAHMVLHYVASPSDAVLEMVRVTRPGGTVVVVDFEAHEREWMRAELGVEWMGFPLADVHGWLSAAGAEEVRIETLPPRGKDLPASFVASARVPATP